MKSVISLNGEWQLKCMDPYVPLRDNSMETGKPLQGITRWISAQVPGGVTTAMYRAGFIDYPYSGMNSLKCEWLEHRWWIYRKEIELAYQEGTKVILHFGGVDYQCMVYVNHQLLGVHEGMYEDFSFDITSICQETSKLLIECLVLHVPDEMGQIGMTSETFTQKSRFGYKWDFSTHLVNLGLWQGVDLQIIDGPELEEYSLLTDAVKITDLNDDVKATNLTDVEKASDLTASEKMRMECSDNLVRKEKWLGTINLSGKVHSFRMASQVKVSARVTMDGENAAEASAFIREDGSFSMKMTIPEPQLWYPNGMGKQPLYDVEIQVWEDEILFDCVQVRCGIRHLEYLQNEGGPENARCYTLKVNGLRMYIKGVNMVPLDHVYGDVTQEFRKAALKRAAEMNVNLVRIWGGGVIETEEFYDLCDEMGILIWQEFIQSSSGIDNMPSHKPEFLKLLAATARCALKKKRNHTCLAMWSGGNELMTADRRPIDETDQNIAMLAGLAGKMDPTHQFLPTSPSGPNCHITAGADNSHDVHGWWQYQGNPIQYSYFGDTDSLLHSEFGCDGMSSEYTVRRILGDAETTPQRMAENDLWRFHGDWWCTYDREEKMFGPIADLKEYIKLSQWMQGEGLRFILESNRRRLPRNSGSIIWQLNEPWPNLSCTTLMDYYLNPKLVYYWTKEAFAKVHASLNYRRLDYEPGTEFRDDLFLCADSCAQPGEAKIIVSVHDLKGKEYYKKEFCGVIVPDCAQKFAETVFTVPEAKENLFMVRVHLITDEEEKKNDYWFSTTAQHPYHAAIGRRAAKVEAIILEKSADGCLLRLKNPGQEILIHAAVISGDDDFLLSADRNYLNLLPGESADISIKWEKRCDLPFDSFTSMNPEKKEPKLKIQAIGLSEDYRLI